VYDLLTERGYRVIPQVKFGGKANGSHEFRIDMVVEDHQDNRLAIECDGDRYHGPDRWNDDMRRQRILERAGWHFWRCFASIFVMRREEVIDDLLNTLNEMGIEPIGTEGASRSLHSQQRLYTAFPMNSITSSEEVFSLELGDTLSQPYNE
jgi:very-short-patch-repair endonuclease